MVRNSVVISGYPGSGKSTVIKLLSKDIGWPVHAIGQYFRDRYSELHPNKEITFEEYWRNTSLEENERANNVVKKMMDVGNMIFDSRYSAFYCDPAKCLLVFITADIDVRVERSSEYKQNLISKDEMKKKLLDRQADEMAMGKRLYGDDFDYTDPKYYHLILDSGKLTVREELDYIKEGLRGNISNLKPR